MSLVRKTREQTLQNSSKKGAKEQDNRHYRRKTGHLELPYLLPKAAKSPPEKKVKDMQRNKNTAHNINMGKVDENVAEIKKN